MFGKVKIALASVESIAVKRVNVADFYYTNLKTVSVGMTLHQRTQLLPTLFNLVGLLDPGSTFF